MPSDEQALIELEERISARAAELKVYRELMRDRIYVNADGSITTSQERLCRLMAENDRLTALLAERDAEIARLKLTTRSDREYAEMKQRAEEAEGEIARLREAGRALADALSAFSVDVGALPEVRQYRLTHLDADPDPDYPVTVMHPWGAYRVVDDRLEDWYAALAARGGEVQG